MNFYSHFTTNKNSNTKLIEDALVSTKLKLKDLDLSMLEISDYNKKYLGEHIKEYQKTAWFLSHIFMLVNEKGKSLKDVTLVDYGGGSGVLSYAAKELGIGTVIYNDIYDVSCNDVKVISQNLNINIDHIIPGDITDVVNYLNEKNINVDFVIAHDVIEHIYNVDEWYTKVKLLMNENSTIICTSHANKYNPLIRKKLNKLQINAEHNTQKKQWGHKERDSLESFYEIRKQIIADHATKLKIHEIENLARATRGLMKNDIVNVVDTFISDGEIAFQPTHPLNTCDPNTGNWVEQLIDLEELASNLSALGYNSKITPGYYISSKGNIIIKYLKIITNYIIHFLKKKGLYFAPYYVITSQLKKI